MAVAPLFVVDRDTLLARVRLPHPPEEVQPLVDDAIERARAWFYRRLDVARVAELVATADSDSPTTNAGVKRMIASTTEVLMTRWCLADTLPVLFERVGEALRSWNEVNPFHTSSDDRQKFRDALEREIEGNLELLTAGAEDLGEETRLEAKAIGGGRARFRRSL
jgi:hypothetical protein